MDRRQDLNRVEQLLVDAADLGHLYLDKFKLRLLSGVSSLFNSIFSVFVLIILAGFTVFFLAVGLTLLISEWVNSYIGGVMIMAGIFFLAFLIVFALRKTLFANKMVRMLSKVLFESDKDLEND